MLTFFHSPHTRSTVVRAAIHAMGVGDRMETRLVTIPRVDGSGGRDPSNPHPEGKVPVLMHDGRMVWERPAILTYLSDLFPEAAAICPAGHPERGPFLSWLAWYGDVVEPVLSCAAAGISHDYLTAGLRGPEEVTARLSATLSDGRPWLLESGFTVADLLLHSPFAWFSDMTPDDPAIRAWVERCKDHPSSRAALEADARDLRIAA
jgi:glutathione S-transferase